MGKIKVHTLAKKHGIKSAEFVKHLANIGFPVTSYQASLDEWDIPVIEMRLIQGRIIEDPDAVTEKASDSAGSGDAMSWDDLMKAAPAPDTSAPEDDAEVVDEETVAAQDDAVETTEEIPAPETTEVVETEATETPAENPEVPEATEAATEDEAIDEAPSVIEGTKAEDPQEEDPQEEATPEEDPQEEATVTKSEGAPADDKPKDESGKSTTIPASKAPKGPVPKPGKSAATKLGKIDLAALGLAKSQLSGKKKGSTFTDIRDRESARRRDQRSKQREAQRDRRRGKGRPKHVSTIDRKGDVTLEAPVTVKSFSLATGIPSGDILRQLFDLDIMATINQVIDGETLELLADEYEIGIRIKEETDIEAELMEEILAGRHAVDDSSIKPRRPVIAFLGHVDHGKTSLIDAIRSTRVAAKEAGGITQHVGAYVAELSDGREVTILDTPGHAAFSDMRARGAQTTDIVVLVVAADDGIKPQTLEAINHARAAATPVVVALNKIDTVGANTEKVKAELANHGLQAEDWGGETGIVEVSALKKQGIDDLLERVLLEAEVMNLSAHAKGDAIGTVLEAKVETGKGKVAHVLIQDGTLKPKDVVLVGHTYGKIRLLFDHNGKPCKEAGPSTPVEVLGLDSLPSIGEKLYALKDLKAAKAVAEKRLLHRTEIERASKGGVTLSNLFEKLDESVTEKLRFVVKTDVQGSAEVLVNTLKEMSSDEVIVEIVHQGVGGVSLTDIQLASTAEAIVIAFNVKPEGKARKEAERVGVEIRPYNVIYDVVDDVEKAIAGLLAPDKVEKIVGQLEVLEVFTSSRWGTIAGSRVLSGFIKRICRARVIRDGKVIVEAQVDSLRHFKDDVREVKEGNECGVKLVDFSAIQAGDTIEAIEMVEIARTLEDAQLASIDKEEKAAAADS